MENLLHKRCMGRRAQGRRSITRQAPGLSCYGAGEGNRTLVVSLEGFCSTIELHPPAGEKRLCHCARRFVNARDGSGGGRRAIDHRCPQAKQDHAQHRRAGERQRVA